MDVKTTSKSDGKKIQTKQKTSGELNAKTGRQIHKSRPK